MKLEEPQNAETRIKFRAIVQIYFSVFIFLNKF